MCTVCLFYRGPCAHVMLTGCRKHFFGKYCSTVAALYFHISVFPALRFHAGRDLSLCRMAACNTDCFCRSHSAIIYGKRICSCFSLLRRNNHTVFVYRKRCIIGDCHTVPRLHQGIRYYSVIVKLPVAFQKKHRVQHCGTA